jgi:GDP-L-fucose synthase
MTILITGASGFVGSSLEGDIRVSSRDADLKDFNSTLSLFSELNPKTVIHAAAKHGNFSQIESDKVGYYRENALININVFEAARLSGVEQILAFSSVTAFPDHIHSFSEVDLYKGEPHPSCYPYAYAKRIIEVLCRAYKEQYDLNYNCMFLANAYGPRGRDNVIPTLIEKCMHAKKANIPFEIMGDGSPRRDFIFISDVRRIVNALLARDHFGPLIISSGESFSIREVVDEIVIAVEFPGEVIWDTDHDVGQKEKIPGNQKLMSLIPGFEFTPLREGIEQTVAWHRERDPKSSGS